MSQNGENPGLCEVCGGATHVTELKWVQRVAEQIENALHEHSLKLHGRSLASSVDRRMGRLSIENIIVTEMNKG